MGASLLALAKSIYLSHHETLHLKTTSVSPSFFTVTKSLTLGGFHKMNLRLVIN